MSNTNNHNQLPAMPVNAGLDNDDGRVSNEDIRKYVADSAQQMSFRCLFPQEVHDRMWQLFKMTVRFTQREMEQDLSFAPLAVTREFLKKEHHAYVLDREKWATEERIMGLRRQELAIERQCIAAEKAELNDQKRKLAAERLQLEAKKKIARAGLEVLVVTVPPVMSFPEQRSLLVDRRVPVAISSTSQEKDVEVHIEHEPGPHNENAQDTLTTQKQAHKRTRSQAGLDENLDLPLPLPHQNVKYFEPGKPTPVAITQLEACVSTTTKVVDLHILKRPYVMVRPSQPDPNIHTPLITSVLSSLFAPGIERRLKY
ncbi:hypothetical protein NCU07595 [Neurospora crassa OR74A]|uniref:Uncharacterized protein n=1 Tax=Neurospora crassa (strain ATCC 24698 / 74-OR23-1A / CBS 708.71 / DSM 1257 / FGSC 987) TaxID=367110 RepID=Q7SBG1_NEUCR|nr:hypothetical protein NCU07595 [Neurospora crassa OR74A]EAA33739.1 hypothetical protein NCU07595 [Neurospora crassa OR74A]|eukprot:XP_962975.1 hypothetical protein NCU07595 [Neurospora crassa OR74A]